MTGYQIRILNLSSLNIRMLVHIISKFQNVALSGASDQTSAHTSIISQICFPPLLHLTGETWCLKIEFFLLFVKEEIILLGYHTISSKT